MCSMSNCFSLCVRFEVLDSADVLSRCVSRANRVTQRNLIKRKGRTQKTMIFNLNECMRFN